MTMVVCIRLLETIKCDNPDVSAERTGSGSG
jgi:hypothetical protein